MDISGDVYRNPHWLREQYVDRDRTVPEIADEVGVTRATIRKWMGKYGIETTGKGPTPDDTSYRDAEWLERMYHGKGHTAEEIGEKCDASRSVVQIWLHKHDIETRNHGHPPGGPNPMQDPEVAEKHPVSGATGEDHPAWIGEDGGWRKREPWTSLRLERIESDDEACVGCGLSREEHRDMYGQDLDVHHIEPTSQGGERYELDNLETLCRPCHSERHEELKQQGE